jgi:hypothetical protein
MSGEMDTPEVDTAALELEAISEVASVAQRYVDRLPADSPWRDLLDDLATSLNADAARLPLVGSPDSARA